MDLGILVLRIGGPRLLHTFNHLNHLPSASTIYKALKRSISIKISLDCSIEELVESNIKTFYQSRRGEYCIKMDEIAIVPKCRYHHETNELIGTCYNHKTNQTSYKLNSILDIEEIDENINSNKIHYAKECLVIGISSMGTSELAPKPILMIPICSHSNESLIKDGIPTIVNKFESLNPDAILYAKHSNSFKLIKTYQSFASFVENIEAF